MGGIFAVVLLVVGGFQSNSLASATSNIKRKIILESIASYRGSCPCPFNIMRNGRSCGDRSAYSRPGGKSPICYPENVTDEMVEAYRQSHK